MFKLGYIYIIDKRMIIANNIEDAVSIYKEWTDGKVIYNVHKMNSSDDGEYLSSDMAVCRVKCEEL